jgi:hypothetical protein
MSERCNLGVLHLEHPQDTAKQAIWSSILEERRAQDAKWGEQNHLHLYWLGILGEEYGEVAKALIEDQPIGPVIEELTQVAAVCVAWLEAIRRAEAQA